jgi:hypothetical protein
MASTDHRLANLPQLAPALLGRTFDQPYLVHATLPQDPA